MGIVWVFARTGSALTALLAISALSGSAQAQTPQTPDISGAYWAAEYHAKIQLVGGGDLPLTDKGKKAYETNMESLKEGSHGDAAQKICCPERLRRVVPLTHSLHAIHAPNDHVTN